nr:MAG TPA: hypothetical protein [Caudoviricetes sp.]
MPPSGLPDMFKAAPITGAALFTSTHRTSQ